MMTANGILAVNNKIMGKIKHGPNLFLGVAELIRMQKFLNDDGYKSLILKNSGSFGVVKYEADSLFDNFKVVEDVAGSGNYKIATNDSFAIDSQGRFIRQRTIGDQPVIDNGAWYWVKIAHNFIKEEIGTVSIDINGNLTGIGTEFTEILRGAPNFPSKIRLLDSASNLLDYEVVEVINDTTLLLAGVVSSFTAESTLTFAVVGTFSPGFVPASGDKYPFQYDGCTITLVAEGSLDTPPAKTDGEEFYIARVKNVSGTLTIHDKRVEQYRSTAEFNLSNILKVANPLIGVEWAKYRHGSTSRDTNLLQVGFGIRTAAWTLDAPNRAITFSTGTLDAGKYKSTSQFSDDELNGWRVYFKDGSYAEVVDSEKQGTAIKCTLKEVNPTKLTTGDIITCVPASDQVEIKATSDGGTIPSIDEQHLFDTSAGFGLLELTVAEQLYKYQIWYRYHKGGEASEWVLIPSDTANGYYDETSWDDNGKISATTNRKVYTLHATEGYIELIRPTNAYTTFVQSLFTGDQYGYQEFELDNGTPIKTFTAGTNHFVQRCKGVGGSGPLSVNHVIGLKNTDAVIGNSFTFIFDVGIKDEGFSLTINSNWASGASPGTPIFTFREEDFDYPYLTQCNVIVKCTYNGSLWVAHVVDQDPSIINDIKMISAINVADFPTGKATIGTKHQGWALCDGANGTQDLRSKFVMGFSNGALTTPAVATKGVTNTGAIGNSGGSNHYNLSGAESGTPEHGHADNIATSNGGSHSHASGTLAISSSGEHTHIIGQSTNDGTEFDIMKSGDSQRSGNSVTINPPYNGSSVSSNHEHTASDFTGSTTSDSGHAHSVTGGVTDASEANASELHENRPAYVVLGFLQRIKQS